MSKYLLKPFYHQDHSFQLYGGPQKSGDLLSMTFKVEGNLDRLFLPRPMESDDPKRVIGLWESTCFEFFIKSTKREDYLELNLTSDHSWNVFYFKYLKDQVKEYEGINAIKIHSKREKWGLELSCELPINLLPENFWQPGHMRMGITAVTEDKRHKKEYWALNHLDPQPYFHNPDTFLAKDFER